MSAANILQLPMLFQIDECLEKVFGTILLRKFRFFKERVNHYTGYNYEPAKWCRRKVKGIRIFRGEDQIIWDVSLNVRQGEVVTLLGANCTGKG